MFCNANVITAIWASVCDFDVSHVTVADFNIISIKYFVADGSLLCVYLFIST